MEKKEEFQKKNKTKKLSGIDIVGELLRKNFKNGEIKCGLHYLGTKSLV